MVPSMRRIWRPSSLVSRSSRLSATTSTRPSLRASWAVNDLLATTACTASSTLRCRSSAKDLIMAAASSVALARTSSGRFSPCPPTGWAAPVLVPGAIAATSADMRMKNPADAARAPAGATYTTTGTVHPVMAVVISRVASSSPPGVSSSITAKVASRAWASSRTRSMKFWEAGWMVSSTRKLITSLARTGHASAHTAVRTAATAVEV